MSLPSLCRCEASETADAILTVWTARLSEGSREQNPFEIDDEELASVLAELPEPSRLSLEELAALEEAEVPSLWFL